MSLTEQLSRVKASWFYPIYVPSYGRAGVAPLLDILAKAPQAVRSKVHVVVRRGPQEREYRAAYPWARLVVHSAPYGVGRAREAAWRHARKVGHQRILMIDDDMSKVGLLEHRGHTEHGAPKSGRLSRSSTSWSQGEFTLRTLGLGCRMADVIFEREADVAYGAPREAFMSNGEDLTYAAVIGARKFPCAVFFMDVRRFTMGEIDKRFRLDGEDLAMQLHALQSGYRTFQMSCMVYESDSRLPSTIENQRKATIDRTHIAVNAEYVYNAMSDYIKVTKRNPDGSIKGLGIDWRRWHRDAGTEPQLVTTDSIVNTIKETL